MYVIKAKTHGCVRNDSETHSTGVTGLHSRLRRSCNPVTQSRAFHCHFAHTRAFSLYYYLGCNYLSMSFIPACSKLFGKSWIYSFIQVQIFDAYGNKTWPLLCLNTQQFWSNNIFQNGQHDWMNRVLFQLLISIFFMFMHCADMYILFGTNTQMLPIAWKIETG